MFGLFGSSLTSAKSDSRVTTFVSGVARYQCSPASSERKSPSPFVEFTVANRRLGMLGATVMPMRPSPSCSKFGRPLARRFHVAPPSNDLYRPEPEPENAPFSHGP